MKMIDDQYRCVDIRIAENLELLEDLDGQIKVRRKLIEIMVGTLWPRIVRDEISRLIERRRKIEKIVKENYEYYGKGRDNRVG